MRLSDITNAKKQLEGEVAERQRAEQALRRSLAFEEGLSKVSKLFTGAYVPDFREVIQILGKVVGADASFLGVTQEANYHGDLVVEWTGQGEPPVRLSSMEIDPRRFPYWYERLSVGELVAMEDVSVLPPDAEEERAFLDNLKVRSLLLVPMVSEEQSFWGFMGFAHLETERTWVPEELRLLRVACEILSNYLARQRAEDKLKHDAFHDGLTGLPNRSLVMDRLAHALHRLDRRPDMCFAVLFIDLDRFKPINDTLGHHAGDQLLVEVAQRLLECVRLADTVARLGGDEFIVMLEELTTRKEVRTVADRILRRLEEPFMIDDQEVFISCSIGIAILDQSDRNAEDVLRNADIAMYRAKLEGKSRYMMFDPSMETHTRSTFQLTSDLRRAAEREQFELYYQPVISLSSGKIKGFEALLRWRHGERGMISPGEFIPIAEESGLMGEIGDWVLRMACRQNRIWQDSGYEGLSVAVNVSARQFYEQRLAGTIREILRDSGMKPSGLEIEITESILMDNVETNIQMLHELKALGLRILIDDFGTGYSSLSYLKRFPLDALKIDQSFTREIPDNPDDAAITTTIIAMANSLNLGVIAEGVENHDQLTFLREHGCKQVQGYLFSRPVPADEATLMLQQPHIQDILTAQVS
jgi:diguanylate cyclase (GGDEF)-like protein